MYIHVWSAENIIRFFWTGTLLCFKIYAVAFMDICFVRIKDKKLALELNLRFKTFASFIEVPVAPPGKLSFCVQRH